MSMSDPLSIWAVSDGRAGMENQALGLAEAVARQRDAVITVKRLKVQKPFDGLPRWAWGDPEARLAGTSDTLALPLPDLWIATGRRTIPFSLKMKGRGPFVVQTQDPRVPEGGFDLVVPPAHDMLRGANVFPILGSPNRLTEEQLSADAATLEPFLPDLPRPLVTVLIGGTSKDYHLTEESLHDIIVRLRDLMASGVGLLISTSRRTGDEALSKIRASLAGPRAYVWDGGSVGGLENPYLGMLGLGSRILVTEESANMLTDAAFTGKPVHLLPLKGGAPKWVRLHEALERHGVLRPRASYTDEWDYEPLRETDRAAAEILGRMEDED